MTRPDAMAVLAGLTGRTIHTLTGRPNTTLRIEGDQVIVAMDRSPNGQPVPIRWIQDALAPGATMPWAGSAAWLVELGA